MAKQRWLAACAGSALVLGLASPAHAQESDSPAAASTAPQDAEEVQGETIVVTAQGREQALSEVPIAVSAVSDEQLELTGASDIRQLNQVAPSLLVSSTGSESNTSARIRGIGTVGDNPGLESSVAVFIDGVYRSRTGTGFNELGEIERIEILRGPQGTLFGRNASAGILNIVTKGPEFDLRGYGEVQYGNYDYWRVSGGITGPVSDTLALRLDGVWSKRDGFFKDVNTGYEVNNRDRYLLRGQMLFEPSSDLSVRIIGDYSKRQEACCGAVYASPALEQNNGKLISAENPIVPVLLDVAGVDFDSYFPAYDDPYSRRIAVTPGRSYDGDTEDWGISGQIDYRFGDVSLTSITAYRDYSSYQQADADYGLADILYFGPDSGREFQTFSQELRLQGSAFDDKLDWLVGGYYAKEDLTTRSQLTFGSDYGAFASCRLLATLEVSLQQAIPGFQLPMDAGQEGCLAGPGGALTAGTLGAIFPDPPGATTGAAPFVSALRLLSQVSDVGDNTANFDQTSENFAFFTHNIVHLTDKLDLTLGLRYTNETKRLNANFNNTNTICPQVQGLLLPYLMGAASTTVPTSLTGGAVTLACQGNSTAALNGITLDDERKEDKFTGTGVLSYQATDDLMVYASFSTGYKAGGFNLDRSAFNNPPEGGPLPIFPVNQAFADYYASELQFDEETVDAYEIGLKYAGPAFSLNVAAFRQEFANFQLNTFNGTFYIVQNINGCSSDLGDADNDMSLTTGACDPDDVTPGVVSQGVEVEASLVPVRNLRVGMGVTYADTRYADNLVGSDEGDPLDPALRLLPGDNLSNAPEWVVTSSLAWTPDIGSSGLSGLVYVDSRLVDDYNTGSDLFPQKEQDSFVLVNARVGIRGPDERWAIEAWAQNLLNKGYTQVGFSSPFQAAGAHPAFSEADYPGGTQIFSAFLAEPRTYGVTLRGRF